MDDLEGSIEALESELKSIDAQLHDPEKFKELSKDADFYEKYEARKKDLEKMMKDWEKAQEEFHLLEQKKAELDN